MTQLVLPALAKKGATPCRCGNPTRIGRQCDACARKTLLAVEQALAEWRAAA